MNTGLHDVPRKHYDAIERVNFSTLKHFARSPAHYRHALTAPHEDTDALALGRAIHVAVFEPEKFRGRYVRWEGGRRYGKEWDAFVAEFKGREVLRDQDYALCLAISESARRDATAAKYLSGGKGEQTLIWTHKRDGAGAISSWEIECKGRLDFISNAGVIADLKSCRDASPTAFGRQCASLGYHIQGAWYQDAYETITGKRLPYVVIAVEKAEPYVVQCYEIPDDLLEYGREVYCDWLDQLHVCRDENRWPGYFDGLAQLALPRWAVPEEEDSAGMGLDFGETATATDTF